MYVKKYIDFFGLYEWELFFSEDTNSMNRALVCWHTINDRQEGSGMIATFQWRRSWIVKKETTKDEIKKVAFHEVLELLLGKVRDFGENKTVLIPDYVVDEEIHKIIRRIENKVFNLIE
jgi:hypothetical protein